MSVSTKDKFICPAKGCGNEMHGFDVEVVYGSTTVPGIEEPIHELIINQPVSIYKCDKCNIAIIVDSVPKSTLDVPEEKKIILPS